MTKKILLALALMTLAGCGAGPDTAAQPEGKRVVETTDAAAKTTPRAKRMPAPKVKRTRQAKKDDSGVEWSKYAPAVRTRIEKQAKAQDCGGLQNEFDNAERNGGTDLMVYVDKLMREAGCY